MPEYTVSTAIEEVSPVKAKAGGPQTVVQACLLVGQEPSKLQAPFHRF